LTANKIIQKWSQIHHRQREVVVNDIENRPQ